MADPDPVRDLVGQYIEAVERTLSTPAATDATTALQAVALELGLTPHELDRADQAADDHAVRARGYLDQHLWDDGIGELALAVALRPTDLALRRDLARAHAHRWRAIGDAQDRDVALRLAQGCVQVAPDDAEAFALIASLRRPRGPGVRGRVVAGALLVVLVVVGGGAIALSMPRRVTAPASVPSPSPTAPDAVSVAWAGPADIEWVDRGSELSIYSNDSWSYTALGQLINRSDQEISLLRGELVLHDDRGQQLARLSRDLGDRDIAYRPGDAVAVSLLVHQGGRPPAKVTLHLPDPQRRPGPPTYPAAPAVEVDWSRIAVPGAWSMTAGLRGLQISDRPSMFGEHTGKIAHRPTLTVTNQGAVIELLKAEVVFLGADGDELGRRGFYLVGPSDPPLWPSDQLLTEQIAFLPGRAEGVRLDVVEAR